MPGISLCMIAFNEAETLPRALANWRELADELIVVVDSRTTDNTAAIVKDAGGIVLGYEYAYPGNKGAMRNVGLDAATGEWIVVLDADEIIRQPAELRRRILSAGPGVTALNVLFENYDDGRMTLRWYQVRVFRRGLYRYIHREHELPQWSGQSGVPNEAIVDMVFEHRAPSGRAPGKAQPMLDRLRMDVEEHPGDPHPLYFLHRQHLLNGDDELALEWGQRYLACPNAIDPCECYGNMATACIHLERMQEAVRWLSYATAEQPERRIWWIRLAKVYMDTGRANVALAHLRLVGELWPDFAWQWEPEESNAGIGVLIDECQFGLAAQMAGAKHDE